MSLTIHSGTAAIDLNTSGTYRQDISEVLLVSLTPQNNLLGAIQVGAEFAGPQLYWVEDALNQFKITGDTTASMTSAVTTIIVSQSDASVIKVGYTLQNDTTVGTLVSAEQLQVTAISGNTLTVSRAYAGTAQSYASNTVFRVVNAPTYPNSDLGPDLSRARLSKTNYINRFRMDVNLDSEQIIRSHQGYVPGVVDELGYQFQQRYAELLRLIEQAVLYANAPASGNPTNDFEQMYGLTAWLDTTANSLASPITTSQPFSDTVLNTTITNIFKQGANSKLIGVGPRMGQILNSLYSDTIRREQSDRVRGFWAQIFDPATANPHEIVMDAFINDTAANALAYVLDPDRIFLRPQLGQFLYTIEAPTMRDGDSISLLSKLSLEVRNSGTDAGYAHQLIKNLA